MASAPARSAPRLRCLGQARNDLFLLLQVGRANQPSEHDDGIGARCIHIIAFMHFAVRQSSQGRPGMAHTTRAAHGCAHRCLRRGTGFGGLERVGEGWG